MVSRRALRSASSSKLCDCKGSKETREFQISESCKLLRRSARLNCLEPAYASIQAEGSSVMRQQSPQKELAISSACAGDHPERPTSTSYPAPRRKRKREDTPTSSTKRCRKIYTPQIAPHTLPYILPVNSIDHWRESEFHWPLGNWVKPSMEAQLEISRMLARKRSSGSVRRKRSDNDLYSESSKTSGDQKSRETKSAPYRDARYSVVLATKGSFMDKYQNGIVEQSKILVQQLLAGPQATPQESRFRDDIFDLTCGKLQDRNETRVIRDISLLIVPSAEMLTTYGDTELGGLTESVNEGWNNSLPVTQACPQPDYAVGFRREAFSEEQLQKLQPFVGDVMDQSFFMATYYLYFPFLTCEVKCGAAALDVADRQNAHSMTLAVRAVVELFRLVNARPSWIVRDSHFLYLTIIDPSAYTAIIQSLAQQGQSSTDTQFTLSTSQRLMEGISRRRINL